MAMKRVFTQSVMLYGCSGEYAKLMVKHLDKMGRTSSIATVSGVVTVATIHEGSTGVNDSNHTITSNKDLFCALAAMTEGEKFGIGEWIIREKDGQFFKFGDGWLEGLSFRKATKEELIKFFEGKEEKLPDPKTVTVKGNFDWVPRTPEFLKDFERIVSESQLFYDPRLNLPNDYWKSMYQWNNNSTKSYYPPPGEPEPNPIKPDYYGGKDNPYEVVKVINALGLNFELGNTLKYIARFKKKGNPLQDLKKAKEYLEMEIKKWEKLN